jgi:hypothetical protein
MEKMKFDKQKLLEVLRANRESHRKIFLEACTGYLKKAIELLEQKLASAKRGERITMHFSLQQPIDQTKEYDRAIRMLEMSTNAIVELEEHDFQQYVMDDWAWKGQFLTSNSAYSGTALLALQQNDQP